MERAHPKAQKASPPRQFDAKFFIIPCTFMWYKIIFLGGRGHEVICLLVQRIMRKEERPLSFPSNLKNWVKSTYKGMILQNTIIKFWKVKNGSLEGALNKFLRFISPLLFLTAKSHVHSIIHLVRGWCEAANLPRFSASTFHSPSDQCRSKGKTTRVDD